MEKNIAEQEFVKRLTDNNIDKQQREIQLTLKALASRLDVKL